VLLDEPTANRDLGYQIEMLRLLRELAAREGFVAVIVTHELNLAAEFADLPALTRRRTMRPPRDSQPRLGLGPAEPRVPEAGAGGPESVKRPPSGHLGYAVTHNR
jgi:ABC-type nitrate/sulfonate/bicarbonate transport system ATPase subunit